MKLFQSGPILASSLICITINMYCAQGHKITPPHVINVREGIGGSSSDDSSPIPSSRSALAWGPHSPRAEDLRELPDDDSDMEPLTAHQLAHQYLANFQGNTAAALPHVVAVLEKDMMVKKQLASCMQIATRGGMHPLFINKGQLIHAKTPRGPTRGFLDDMNTALPMAQELVNPIVNALTNTSEKLATTEQEKADLTTQHEALKANSNYKAAGWTAVGSIASFLIAAGLSIGSTYIGSLATAPQTVECIVTLVNATLGG